MIRILLSLTLTFALAMPTAAQEITAPTVPPSCEEWMPEDTASFAEGLWSIITKAIGQIQPDLKEAAGAAVAVMACVMLISLVQTVSETVKNAGDLVGTAVIAATLLQCTNSMIHLGSDVITQMSDYGKLLLPVMTAAAASQGAITASTALYTGTAFFDALLGTLISRLLVPLVYLYLVLAVANSALGEELLKKMRDFLKWGISWCLKSVLTVFTTYMGITGVVSGTTDAMTLKAAKATISTVVPVVGGIMSDATEAVLISGGVVKNAAGVYGILAVLAICLGPFLRIGSHYLVMKLTAAVCGVFGSKRITELVSDFSSAMGLLLAMTGAVCLLLLISTVCFMKGAS